MQDLYTENYKMARETPGTVSEESCAVVVGREPRHLRCRSYTDSSMDSTQFKIAEEFFYRKGQAYPGNTQDLANTKHLEKQQNWRSWNTSRH